MRLVLLDAWGTGLRGIWTQAILSPQSVLPVCRKFLLSSCLIELVVCGNLEVGGQSKRKGIELIDIIAVSLPCRKKPIQPCKATLHQLKKNMGRGDLHSQDAVYTAFLTGTQLTQERVAWWEQMLRWHPGRGRGLRLPVSWRLAWGWRAGWRWLKCGWEGGWGDCCWEGGWPSSRPPGSRPGAHRHPRAGSHPGSHQTAPAGADITDSTLTPPPHRRGESREPPGLCSCCLTPPQTVLHRSVSTHMHHWYQWLASGQV